MIFVPCGRLSDGRCLALPRAPQPPLEPLGPVLIIGGAIEPADIPALCERVRLLVARAGRASVACDVSAVADADLLTIDALARLALVTRQLGSDLRLQNPSAALEDLVGLVGLAETLLGREPSGVEPVGQPEQRKVAGGVQEERDPADPAA
jgi:ABC-type transporter Mla MlaB component